MSEGRGRLVIIGASGHGKVAADIAELMGYEDIVFLDDDPSIEECHGHSVIGAVSALPEVTGDVFVAVGNTGVRRMLMEVHRERRFPVLIHPNAVIARDVAISGGTVVMAGAVINPGARIGRGCIVNTCASIDHDCVVGDFTHVSVGTHLCGTVTVGRSTWIGAGATVSNNLEIADGCTIGAGAVVVRDIREQGTYVGVPARKVMNKKQMYGGGHSSVIAGYS